MTETAQKGLVIVVSGPSGSGKTTLARRLVEQEEGIQFSVSATTRPAREGETDGVDYAFMTQEQFKEDEEAGRFIETAQVFGEHWYGTPRKPIEEATSQGIDVLLDIDVQGGTQVKDNVKDAVLVFLLPPSPEVIQERLKSRGTESEQEIAHRMTEVLAELGYAVLYPYLVINDDLDRACDALRAIRLAEKCRYSRRRKDLPWKI